MKNTESLTLNKEFGRVYKKGRSIVSPFVVIYYLKNRRQKNRIGITTSKKIGNAVSRNRARRIMKEAYRLLEPQIPVGYDFVFVARVKTAKSSMNDIYTIFERELLKL